MAYWNIDKKLIYIHIYKTGGESVRRMLDDIKGNDLVSELYHKHARIEQVEEQMKFNGNDITEQTIFTTVRNPYDWFVSLYEFIQSRPGHPLNKFVKDLDFVEYITFFKKFMMEGQKHEHHLQTQFIDERVKVFKLEEIEKVKDFLKAPNIHHRNKVRHLPFEMYYTRSILKKCEFLRKECELLDYNMNNI